ncbi:MAG TPA: hypothetical protein ENK18_02860 [Deltaproteobacteria bacterium]|nr:hypothetical protein [Deltaproteobacteria bacterium]
MTTRDLATGAVAVVVVGIVWLQGQAMTEQGRAVAATQEHVRLTLHGSTPTMAWSPDGRRVAVSASYTYFGHEAAISSHRSELGIWVVDATSGEKRRISNEQGYHPIWLDDATVAWGHSPYEDGDDGLFVGMADELSVRRIGTMEGVYHTLPAKEGGVLYWSGWPEEQGWMIADPATGLLSSAGVGAGVTSWQVPRNKVKSQCLQQVGKTRLMASRSGDEPHWVIQSGGERHPLSMKPYVFGEDEFAPDEHKGMVRPCLSPDGKKVAFFVAGEGETFGLRIGAVP